MLNKKLALILTSILLPVILILMACSPNTPTTTTSAQNLVINTISLPGGQVGINYSQTPKASGGSGTYKWSITEGSLPTGLSLVEHNGSINGVPKETGTFNFTIQVNDGTHTVSQALSIIIKSTLPRITANSLPEGEVGAAYSQTLNAAGGSGPYTWSVSDGALPDGLAVGAADGVISGKPEKRGTFLVTIQLKDSQGNPDSKSYYITIKDALVITTTSAADGDVGTFYSQTLETSGGSGDTYWTLSGGTLNTGLALSNLDGIIYGTPKEVGKSTFTIQVKDSLGITSSQSYTISINEALAIKTTSIESGQIGKAYSQTLEATGGSGTYSWRLSLNSLPDGLELDAKTGVISGTPKTAGKYSFTIEVDDTLEAESTQTFVITIS
jgi:large repetitive protein